MSSVSIIIPTLNEAQNIGELLSRISACRLPETVMLEVIVVDDASTDGTCEAAEKTPTDFPVRLLRRRGKLGLASAVVDGAAMARGEIVLVMDADLSHPPEAIPQLLAPLLAGASDMTIGSRYVPGGSTPGWSLLRGMASRLATYFAWPLCDAKDPMSGFFAVRQERITQLRGGVSGFKIGLALLSAGGDSLRVHEVPIEFRDRSRGASKLGPRVIFEYLQQLMILAGATESLTGWKRFLPVSVLGLLTDVSVFGVLVSTGATLGEAHLSGFIAAALVSYLLYFRWAFHGGRNVAVPFGIRRYGVFLTVTFLALFLHGGLLSSLSGGCGWSAVPAVSVAALAAFGLQYLGVIFFVFPPETGGASAALRWRVFSLGVVGYTVLLRLVYLGMPELLHEEAYYWNYAQHLDFGYLDHPPAVAWIIHLSTLIFGDSEFGVRFGAYGCWGITAVFVYRLTNRLFDKSSAFRALLLVAVLPIFFGVGFLMTPDAPLVACWSGMLYFSYRALLDGRRFAWIGVGVCLGLGMLSKYTISLLAPATLLFLLLDPPSRRWFGKPEPYVGGFCALVLFSPVIIWNYHHGWVSFLFQGPQRMVGEHIFSVHELIGGVLLLITPTGLGAVISLLFSGKILGARDGGSANDNHRRGLLFGWVFLLVPLSVFVLFSFTKSVKLNWTGPAWLAVIPFMAYGMGPMVTQPLRRLFDWVHRAWPATIAVTLLVFGAWLHYWSLGFPGMPYPENFPLVGSRDLGIKIEQIEDEVESKTGVEPLVVGMDKYRTASLLAFYRPVEKAGRGECRESVMNTSGCHLFGGDSLMYRYWFREKVDENRTMILVSPKKTQLNGVNVMARVREVGDVQRLTVQQNGRPVGNYYYVVVKGYTDGKDAADKPVASHSLRQSLGIEDRSVSGVAGEVNGLLPLASVRADMP